jgi:hypothetical protein
MKALYKVICHLQDDAHADTWKYFHKATASNQFKYGSPDTDEWKLAKERERIYGLLKRHIEETYPEVIE